MNKKSFQNYYLHPFNKFHFSVIHQSMTLTLHGTHCAHTSMNDRKMKFITYIYTFFFTSFLFISCEVLISCQIKRKKSYKPTCLVITFNSCLLAMRLRQPINYFIYPRHHLHVPSQTVVQQSMTFGGPKQIYLRKLLVSVIISNCISLCSWFK